MCTAWWVKAKLFNFRKVRNLESENRIPKAKYDDAVRELNDKVSDLEDRLKDESFARIEEKQLMKHVIQNLQGTVDFSDFDSLTIKVQTQFH